jgi:iduronate 2-sulfatase
MIPSRIFPSAILAIVSLLVGGSVAEETAPARNVLLLVSDDLKAGVLGCYGGDRCRTPNLDALAARAMVFEKAYCQGLTCRPSRLSFMHSRYVGAEGPTLGKHLIDHGFHSARVGKIFHMRVPGDIIAGTDGEDFPETWTERFNCRGQEAHTPGLYRLLNRNIETRSPEGRQSTGMPFRMFASVEADGDGSDQPDWKAAEKTMELLRARAKAAGPFFLATGFVRPHYPSVAPARYFAEYPHDEIAPPEVPVDDLADIPAMGRKGTTSQNSGIADYPDNIRRMWADYHATVTFMDEQIGKILAELDRLGLRESTLVIFTSDHGYHLGEHHFWEKSRFHEEVTRVPLIISAPGLAPGRSAALAELVDIYPTVCEWAGVAAPGTVQGTSLFPLLRDPGAKVRNAAFAVGPTGRLVRTSDRAYIRYRDGSEELYDMTDDPGQFTNRAADPRFAVEKTVLRGMLDGKTELGVR